MSELAKILAEAQPRRGGTKRLLDSILERMKTEDPPAARELVKALNDPDRVSARQLAELITAAGYPCGEFVIKEHRRRAATTQAIKKS